MEKIPSAFERLLGAKANLPNTIEFDGYKWLIGEVSKQSDYPININDLIHYYPLVVRKVLQNTNQEIDFVAVSLPAETFWEDVLSGGEITDRIKSRIEKYVGVNSEVYPQGIIALEEIFVQNKLDNTKPTLVIDGGFNTVNIAVVSSGKIEFTKTYYNEFGIRDLLENYFSQELKRKYPEASSNLQRLKTIFLQEYIDAGFNTIGVSKEKGIALSVFVDNLFNRIIKDVERSGVSFSQFTIIGGLSYYIDQVETSKPYFLPQDKGEFYTVLGMKRASNSLSIDFGFGDIKFVK